MFILNYREKKTTARYRFIFLTPFSYYFKPKQIIMISYLSEENFKIFMSLNRAASRKLFKLLKFFQIFNFILKVIKKKLNRFQIYRRISKCNVSRAKILS